MPKVFSHISAPEVRASNKILDLVRSRGRISKTQLFREIFHTISFQDFQMGVNALLASGRATLAQSGTEIYILYVPTKEELRTAGESDDQADGTVSES